MSKRKEKTIEAPKAEASVRYGFKNGVKSMDLGIFGTVAVEQLNEKLVAALKYEDERNASLGRDTDYVKLFVVEK